MEEPIKATLAELELAMEAACEALKSQLARLRTGRAHISLLDGLRVNAYGSQVPVSQCASLQVVEARMLAVRPWDRKLIVEIERSILASDLGIMPQNDGDTIRLPIPALTEERRRDLVRQGKQRGEDAKIGLRNHRRDANEALKALEKNKEISQDELKRAIQRVQELVDAGVRQCDEMFAHKEKEILAL